MRGGGKSLVNSPSGDFPCYYFRKYPLTIAPVHILMREYCGICYVSIKMLKYGIHYSTNLLLSLNK